VATSRTGPAPVEGAGGPSVARDDEGFGATSHSFIVRMWQEDIGNASGTGWRGTITHVPGGERHYFANPSKMVRYIKPYLTRSGASVSGGSLSISAARRWLRRWTR
jgi:hypothetical protein